MNDSDKCSPIAAEVTWGEVIATEGTPPRNIYRGYGDCYEYKGQGTIEFEIWNYGEKSKKTSVYLRA